MVATQVTYILFVLDFISSFQKREPHIEDMEILISLRILSVTVRRSYLMDYQCTPDVHKKARVRKIFYVVRAHFAHI